MNNSGYNGRFHEDYEVLKDEARKFPKGVEFEHVFGHEGEPGNEAANELARQATAPARAMRSVSVPPSQTNWRAKQLHPREPCAPSVFHRRTVFTVEVRTRIEVVLVQEMPVLDQDHDQETE
ncbi:hypothetical protein Tcan_17983 [Toxocara canis]|uniref:RNase H type-1 domain-containing protein n=1 Tax=Toxocara canis TaxID=6265 RepID=A0A0B2UU43_TOXCA|nr:hypothetical protein Tcan_17983 [Toxocara canis]